MSTAYEPGHDDDAAWWAGLSPEARHLTIETVRLGEDADLPGGEAPTGERAAFVRRQPEYLERFAHADHNARVDDAGFGRDAVPDSHADTAPLADTAQTRTADFRRDV
ncbi:hypothetical protein PCC79_01735 [Propioniciclava soli]|uniref:Uncharacterized protein n=1 Tax=Propioniciclava soli TaxID=2775081 RepID=A0ABZ3C8B7_9ACTN